LLPFGRYIAKIGAASAGAALISFSPGVGPKSLCILGKTRRHAVAILVRVSLCSPQASGHIFERSFG